MESKESENISQQLISMGLKDQEMRFASQRPKDPVLFDKKLDSQNSVELEKVMEEIGWPTISKVGEEASYAAWLIAQHADHEPQFQERCLDLMKDNIDGVDLACLTHLVDRVAVNKGEEQVYGTQFFGKNSKELKPRPIKDPDGLETRRKKMGLCSFELYSKRMRGKYKYPENWESPKLGGFYKVW